MITQPWMKFYIGDWIRDTRKLSVAARGAYQDIRSQMWINDERGVITGDITELQVLLGFRYNEIDNLLAELAEKKIFKVEKFGAGKIKITDESMIEVSLKSAQKAAAGREGMKKRYKKNNDADNSVITETVTPVITSVITYMVSDTDNDTGNDFEKGGAGGKNETMPEAKKLKAVSGTEVLSLPDCLEAFLETNVCGHARDLVSRKLIPYGPDTLTERIEWLNSRLRAWAEKFNERLIGELMSARALNEWSSHFLNWMGTQPDMQINPKESNNGRQSGFKAPSGNTNIASSNILKDGQDIWSS